MKKVNKEKINYIQVNSEYKYFIHDFIAAIVIMSIGFLFPSLYHITFLDGYNTRINLFFLTGTAAGR